MSRRWRVVLLRHKGEILGTVEAPDAEAAKAAGVEGTTSHCLTAFPALSTPGPQLQSDQPYVALAHTCPLRSTT